MQVSRHWRLNPQRYRLQGVRYPNGDVSLQSRPFVPAPDYKHQLETELSIIGQQPQNKMAVTA